MNCILKPISLVAAILLLAVINLTAQVANSTCYNLETISPDAVVDSRSGHAPGDTLGKENDLTVTGEIYMLTPLEEVFESMGIADADDTPYFYHGIKQTLTLNNINARFDFSENQDRVYMAQFYCFNLGGGINIGINNIAPRYYPNFNAVPTNISLGAQFYSEEVTPPQLFGNEKVSVLTFMSNEPIESITVGGEKLFIDNICISHDPAADCRIYNLMSVPMCDSPGVLDVTLFASHTFDNDIDVRVSGNGIQYGTHRIVNNQNIIIKNIGQFGPVPNVLEFLVEDVSGNCNPWFSRGRKPQCQPDTCSIDSLLFEPNLCDINGEFWADLDFKHNGKNDSFSVQINNGNQDISLGYFAYTNLPISIGPFSDTFPRNTTGNILEWDVKIIDQIDTDCFAEKNVIDSVFCDKKCRVEKIEVYDLSCNLDSDIINFRNDSITLSVNFDTTGLSTSTDSFGLIVLNQFLGFYKYNQLPIEKIRVKNTPGTMKPVTVFEYDGIGDIFEFDCQSTNYFRTPCLKCPEDLKLTLDSVPDADGKYWVGIDMAPPASNKTFELYLNNTLIDTFEYANLPFLQQFDCTQFSDSITVKIQDLQDSTCIESGLLVVNCDSQGCPVPDFHAIAENCNGSVYDLQIEFDQNTQSVPVEVFVNGTSVGTGVSTDLLNFKELAVQTSQELNISICEVSNPDCCVENVINNPCLNNCEIEITNAVAAPCDADGNFNIELEVDAKNPTGTNFVIFVNGDLQTTAGYMPNPQSFVLGPFDGKTQNPFQIVIFDVLITNCRAEKTLDSPNCNPIPCNISDIQGEVTRCEGDLFDLNIFFNYDNVASQKFDLRVDNQFIDSYFYTDLPLNLTNLLHDGDGMIDIKVCDSDDNTCCDELSFDNPCMNCEITDFEAKGIDCDLNQEFYFLLTGEITTLQQNDSFEIKVNNNLVRVIGNDDLPILAGQGIAVGPFDGTGGNVFEITINSRYNPDCRAVVYSDFNCPPPPKCELTNMSFQASACSVNQEYTLEIDFDYSNPQSDSFLLFRNGIRYGKFAYIDLPIISGPFLGDGSTDLFLAADASNLDCRVGDTFVAPNCPAPPCSINNLTAVAANCDPDGNFTTDINFDYQNNVSNFFELHVNGNLYNTYRYSDLPVNAGPFSGDGSVYNYLVQDAGDPDCREDINLTSPNCPQPICEISDLTIRSLDCDAGDNFKAVVEFNYQNTVSDSFELLINGSLHGTYAYIDLPITTNSLAGDGSVYNFTVRDADDFNCIENTDFNAPDCTSDNCMITNLSAQAGNCDNNANFPVTIYFDYQNNASDSFEVFINGAYSNTYAYIDLPINIGSFPANGSILGIAVIDQTDASCTAADALRSPTCSPVPCSLENLTVNASGCDINNQFTADIDFTHTAAGDSFLLFVNNSFYNTYTYSDLPITVGAFDGDGSTLNFLVQDQIDNDCSASDDLISPNCTPPCKLSNVTTNTSACDLNGEFYYEVNFEFENTSDSFIIFSAGVMPPEIHAYADLPIQIGPFQGDGTTIYRFNVVDRTDNDCDLSFSAFTPNCVCSISNITTQVSDCDSDGNYSVILNFTTQNSSDSFNISNSSGYSENFAYADLPVTIGTFFGNGQTNNFLIEDLIRTDCIEDFSIFAPDCTPACLLNNPMVTVSDNCDNQGNYSAVINFDYQNTTSNFFNTNGYGIYAYTDLPVTIGPFVGDGSTDYPILITDGNDPDCRLPLVVPAKYCGDSCNIYNVHAEASACDTSGNFSIELTFDSDNTNQAGYLITVNGQAFGPFPYSTPQPQTIGSFAGDGSTSYSIFVFDAGQATCNGSTSLAPVNCLPCQLSDLTTQTTPCDGDGNFSIWIDFDVLSGSSNGFNISGNGNDYGNYDYADLPVLIGPFAGDGSSVYEFIVVDNDDSDCKLKTTVGPVDCNTSNCKIYDITAIPTDCNPDGTFAVDLHFNYQDVGNSGFTIRGNGMIYGIYDYIQLPIRISNLNGDGNTVYEFVIIDNDDPNCNNFTTAGPIDCNDNDCSINDLQVEILDCNGNGTYQVSVNFSYDNPTNTTFDLSTTGGYFGTYLLDQLPLTISDFPSNGNPFDAVRVCITDNRLCCASTFFPTPDCDGDCIEFEMLPYDTTFVGSSNISALDTILVENNVVMTANVFLSASGQVLDSIAADSADLFFDAADGIQLTTHNATIDFDFPAFTGFPCREVTFNYYQPGDLNNISVNGEPIKVFTRFTDLPYNIATAVIAEVFPVNSREGVLKLKGFINTVRIGGEELSFDNICYGECLNFLDVWPGDINLDNWVSHYDILNLGVAYNAQGAVRSDQSTDWESLQGEDWLRFFGRGQNYKHSDCNGDGLVDEFDLDVIEKNYGEFHDDILMLPTEPVPPNAPQIYIEYPNPSDIQIGQPFTGKIILAQEDNQVYNAYGIAFNLRYDKDKFSIVNIQYPPEWFGEPGEDLMTIDRTFNNDGLAHIGISRNNHENVTGHGAIAEFIGIIDDIVGKAGSIDIDIDGIVAISKEEFTVPIGGSSNNLDLSTSVIDLPKGSLFVYPNPVQEKVFFDLKGGQKIESVEVLTAAGITLDKFIPNNNYLSLRKYASGVYILKFMIDGLPYYDRIIKQ